MNIQQSRKRKKELIVLTRIIVSGEQCLCIYIAKLVANSPCGSTVKVSLVPSWFPQLMALTVKE